MIRINSIGTGALSAIFCAGIIMMTGCATGTVSDVRNENTVQNVAETYGSIQNDALTDTAVSSMAADTTETGVKEEVNTQTGSVAEAVTEAGNEQSSSMPATIQESSEAVSQEAPEESSQVGNSTDTGVEGKRFVNDYNSSDRTYTPSDNFISPKDNRGYGQTVTVSYYSTTLGATRQADVILPYNYDAARKYPVLYLLHGMGGSNKSWSDMGVKYIVQNAHYEYGVQDMIVVCPNCYVSLDGMDDGKNFRNILPGYERFESELINDLMPYINSHYATATGRDNTAIAGYSLGGRCSLSIGFKHPDMIGYIGTFSTAGGLVPSEGRWIYSELQLPDGFVLNPSYGDFKLLFMNVGMSDGVCGHTSYEYDEEFTRLGIKHIFYEMEGDHEGTVWQNGLYNFARRIF